MKRLVLMVSLLAQVHAFACDKDDEDVKVVYVLRNESEYGILLKFDEPAYGFNPDNMYLTPYGGTLENYGCDSFTTGYETRATLRATKNGSYFDLAYLYVDFPLLRAKKFSFEKYNTGYPECSCEVHNGVTWDGVKDIFDCSSYTESLGLKVGIHISCK